MEFCLFKKALRDGTALKTVNTADTYAIWYMNEFEISHEICMKMYALLKPYNDLKRKTNRKAYVALHKEPSKKVT